MQDTVGAVAVDSNGQVASAVSSGGIALKHSGRVGHVRFQNFFSSLLCYNAAWRK